VTKQTGKIPTIMMRIEDIHVLDRKRGIDASNVDRLAKSIDSIGLLNPVVVRDASDLAISPADHGGACVLVAGLHRLEAVKKLGLESIECRVVTDSDLQVELMEIDENLCRAELTPAQEAASIARRKKIYLALHPSTGAGKSQAAGMNAKLGRGDVGEKFSPTFAQATAVVSGKNRRSVELAAARGQAINTENLDKIVGTSLDKGVELDALAKIPAVERDELIDRAAKGEKVSARAALKAVEVSTKQEVEASVPPVVSTQEEETQYQALEAAWSAASDMVRNRFGVEVLHLGSAAWALPKTAAGPNDDRATT
jgi:ParB family chromosome partitioning protein